MSQSKLVTYTLWSPHYGYGGHGRNGNKIEAIVVHHMAGNLTVKQCGKVFQTAQASTHYGVNGKNIGQYVREEDAAWACGSRVYNQKTISIELANDGGASTNWHVSDTTIETAIKLIVDICQRNNIKKLVFTGNLNGNLLMHRYITSTACPGNYLASKFKYIEQQVNAKLVKNGIYKEGKYYYYYKDNVKRTKEGWINYGGERYYINEGGKLKHYEHCEIGGKQYVFAKASPKLCRNTTTTIRGKYFESDKNGVVVAHQFWDKVYAYKQDSYKATKMNGSLPTVLAMVISGLSKTKITPTKIAGFLTKAKLWDKTSCGSGKAIKYISEGFGYRRKWYKAKDWKKALSFMRKHNALMIVRCENGNFADKIHYIAVIDVDKDNNVTVYNPGTKLDNGEYSFEKSIMSYALDQKGTTGRAYCVIYR